MAISLSSWLRDYLYIPLGGNKKGKILTYRNLFLTTAIGGLARSFLEFCGMGSFSRGNSYSLPYYKFRKILSIFALPFFFILTNIGWLLFRSENLNQIQVFFYKIVTFENFSFIHGSLPSNFVLLGVILLITLSFYGIKKR